MTYRQLAGFLSNLTGTLADVDTDLPIYDNHAALLRARLAEQDGKAGYTFLKITDGVSIEFVKVSLVGGVLLLARGAEETQAATFAKGSCVSWEITAQAVRDIVCQMDCCP